MKVRRFSQLTFSKLFHMPVIIKVQYTWKTPTTAFCIICYFNTENSHVLRVFQHWKKTCLANYVLYLAFFSVILSVTEVAATGPHMPFLPRLTVPSSSLHSSPVDGDFNATHHASASWPSLMTVWLLPSLFRIRSALTLLFLLSLPSFPLPLSLRTHPRFLLSYMATLSRF